MIPGTLRWLPKQLLNILDVSKYLQKYSKVAPTRITIVNTQNEFQENLHYLFREALLSEKVRK